jgi:hypothetical protein
MSLSNVGLVLSEFQRNEETLAAMQESVDIYRRSITAASLATGDANWRMKLR